MRQRELQAYLIGAGIAGTALVIPYAGRSIASLVIPAWDATNVPFYLLPIVWGFWNWLGVRLASPLPPWAWGAVLGVSVSIGVNLIHLWRGHWFAPLLLLVAWIPIIYAIAWTFVIVPLNRAFDVEP
ncbi:MAG: hypothetical protein KIT14_21370 [bacterium]|nr:hypothetical protein [bacterium]